MSKGVALSVSDRAAELHHAMITSNGPGHLYKQVDMKELVKVRDMNELVRYTQELLNNVSTLSFSQ